ncbi:MAG: hypothetical protein ACWGQW_24940, partial [bacterium]
MDVQQRPSLSELKVGIFVLVACFVLALAIFTIGKVDLFEEQFWAKTYLSNISGLKSGDVVLLGGVEVGNVVSVEITPPGAELPDTELNEKIRVRIKQLSLRLPRLEEEVSTATEELEQAESRHHSATTEFGVDSAQALKALATANQLRRSLQERREALESLNESISRQNSRLQNIEVQMKVSTRYRDWIRADSSIALGSIGLLGDKFIEISLGRSPDPPKTEPMKVDT